MPTSLESEVTIGKFAKRTRYIVGCINHWSLSRCDPISVTTMFDDSQTTSVY